MEAHLKNGYNLEGAMELSDYRRAALCRVSSANGNQHIAFIDHKGTSSYAYDLSLYKLHHIYHYNTV